jgi:branched-chain amino acid transport system substrate-binding protein
MDVKAMSRNLISYGLRALALVAMALLLQACSTGGVNMGNLFKDDKPQAQQAEQQEAQQAPPQSAAVPVKVALLLPLSAPGETANIGKALKNAAEAALLDAGSRNIELITKDTRGNADGARVAANAALNDGAGLILGPLLSSEVKAVKPIAGQRGVPVIAFSSVASVAGNGVYLMSFLPSEEVSNLVRYAKQQGITNIAAMVPQSAYGSTAEQALNSAAGQHGLQIVAMDRYPRNAGAVSTTSQAVAGKVANPTNNIQGLFVPEGGSMLAAAANALSNAGLSPGRTRMLGTGLWDDRATTSIALLNGGWYAGVSPALVERFDTRYRQTYGNSPPRIASLAYDAVSLAIIVSKNAPGGRVSQGAITNPEGFKGVNGLFRFRKSGLIQRGLSILEVTSTGPREIAPAPSRFSAGL